MVDGINGKCARRKKMSRNLVAAVMALSVVASAPTPAHADERLRIEGTFSVMYAYPSAVNYCAGGGGDDSVSIQAQGLGNVPGLGALFLTVKKCFNFSDGTYAGGFMMSAANGDTLRGTYEGTQGSYDENGFGPFQGVLTITGGTGKFRYMRGRLTFGAVAGPDSVGAISSTLNGMAFYLIRGEIVSPSSR